MNTSEIWCIHQLYDGGYVFRPLRSSNFSRTPGKSCRTIALGRFAKMLQLWHVFLCIAELWICGYASSWSRCRRSHCMAGMAAPRWEPRASSIQLLRSSIYSPVWGHGEACPTRLVWLDESHDDNLRWSEKLHRRKRCSNNGNISHVIRSQITEKWSTETALLEVNTWTFLLETHRPMFRSEGEHAPHGLHFYIHQVSLVQFCWNTGNHTVDKFGSELEFWCIKMRFICSVLENRQKPVSCYKHNLKLNILWFYNY